jgi:3-oxoacyl-[acyl-carrier protein] reductase
MVASEKKVVIVTGGSRGIGRAVCLALAGADTHIYFNYVSSEDAAKETSDLIRDAGGQATAVKVDVTSEQQVADFIKQVLEASGRIDVLVNNAGVTRDGLIVRMKEKDWDAVLDTNLKGAFFHIKHSTKTMMKQRSGCIVNVTSVVGVTGNPGQANYVASKAGIIGLTKSAAKELASRGITVNAVAPGYIETDMTTNLSEKAKASIVSMIPMGCIGKPEDVAGVVAFLTTEKASYITGQVLHVSGGMYI